MMRRDNCWVDDLERCVWYNLIRLTFFSLDHVNGRHPTATIFFPISGCDMQSEQANDIETKCLLSSDGHTIAINSYRQVIPTNTISPPVFSALTCNASFK